MKRESTMDGPSQLKVQITSQYVILSSSNEVEWWFAFSFVGRLVAYIILVVVLVIIVALILKFLEECDWSRAEGNIEERETNPLQPAKAVPAAYGTCQEDLESGNCSSGSLEEDLYDGKICIICYDQPRNCFFVPCGHCATCYVCAQRILDGESKTCPVCRRFIGKVRQLFAW